MRYLLIFLQLIFSFFIGICTNACQKLPINTRSYDKIFFLSNRDAPKREFDVFSMNPDGSEQRNLTGLIPGIRTFSQPTVSFDGKMILFVSDQV